VPLSVYSFDSYPEQVITTYAPDGSIVSGPITYLNVTNNSRAAKSPFYSQGNNAGNFVPYSTEWNLEVERPVSKYLLVRANYQQNVSSGLVNYSQEVINGQHALVLSGSGQSRYHQLELTARFSWDQ